MDLCLLSNDYNIIITQALDFPNKGIVSATIYLCDKSTQIQVLDKLNNLDTYFINNINNNTDIITNAITEIEIFDASDIISATTTIKHEDIVAEIIYCYSYEIFLDS